MSTKKVSVFMGGWSKERDISLATGHACLAALHRKGYHAEAFDVPKDPLKIIHYLRDNKPDVVFNALHGVGGEDGTVQTILDLEEIPYTHSGASASSLAMNKKQSKRIYQSVGLSCAEDYVLQMKKDLEHFPLQPPFVIKPVSDGSSVDISIITDEKYDLSAYFESHDTLSRPLLCEAYIPGRELTVTVLEDEPTGPRALTVTEIRPQDDRFYDYESKYDPKNAAVHDVPASLPPAVFEEALRASVTAHTALGCRQISRSDFRYNPDAPKEQQLVILETNTQPGMTNMSLTPEQAQHTGLAFDDLISWMVETSQCD